MEQIGTSSDERLLTGCVYCGGSAESRDHVPSRVLLDESDIPNLPVVPACQACNNGFSNDERYLACLIECVLAGFTDPTVLERLKVKRTLLARPVLRAELEASRHLFRDRTIFAVETSRVRNVLLKLARGHSAYVSHNSRSLIALDLWGRLSERGRAAIGIGALCLIL
jgi:hypothetical protein